MVDEKFFKDLDGLVIIGVRGQVVDVRTDIYDMEELGSVLKTALYMADKEGTKWHEVNKEEKVDNLH